MCERIEMCVGVRVHERQHPRLPVKPQADFVEVVRVANVQDLGWVRERLMGSVDEADTPQSCFRTPHKVWLSAKPASSHSQRPVVSDSHLSNTTKD